MSIVVRALLRLAVLAAGALTLGFALAQDAQPPAADAASTAAEALLFETDHLAGVSAPSVLEYRFTWTGKSAFSDRVLLNVGAAPEHSVEPDYLSGDHHVDFPSVEQARGNPLLLYFLESDLREMQRQTGGQADYFRRLIRRALSAPDLAVESIQVTADGHPVAARRVIVAPFRGDPSAPKRYPALKDKTYEFVLSPAVPGQVVSLATSVAGDDGAMQQAQLVWSRVAPPGAGASAGAAVKQESR